MFAGRVSWKKVINNILSEETVFVNDILTKNEKIYVDKDTDIKYQRIQSMTRLEKVLRVVVKLAEAGDLEAVRFLADYTVGRPRQHIDVTPVLENPYEGLNEIELQEEYKRIESSFSESKFSNNSGTTLRITQGEDRVSKE